MSGRRKRKKLKATEAFMLQFRLKNLYMAARDRVRFRNEGQHYWKPIRKRDKNYYKNQGAMS